MKWTAQLFYNAASLTPEDTAALTATLDNAAVVYDRNTSRLQITLSADAPSLQEAADTVLRTATGATGLLKPTRMHILTAADHSAETAHPPAQDLDLIGVTEIAGELGVSRQRAGQLTADPDFPAPVVHVAAGRLYTRASVQSFHQRWAATRNRRGGRRGRLPSPT